MKRPLLCPLPQAQSYKRLWGFPNNYTLTKHLAELAVLEKKAELPVCVGRLSIVTSTSARHPAPGYLGNAGGAPRNCQLQTFQLVYGVALPESGCLQHVAAAAAAALCKYNTPLRLHQL